MTVFHEINIRERKLQQIISYYMTVGLGGGLGWYEVE